MTVRINGQEVDLEQFEGPSEYERVKKMRSWQQGQRSDNLTVPAQGSARLLAGDPRKARHSHGNYNGVRIK